MPIRTVPFLMPGLAVVLAALLAPALPAQRDPVQTETIQARFWSGPTTLDANPAKPMWRKTRGIAFQHNWRGEPLVGHLTSVQALWTQDELWLLFTCAYDSITISAGAQPVRETDKLWAVSDVAEAFIAPNPGDPMRYKEFQVSPAGQWVDLHIDRETGQHDAGWNSGFRSAARIDSGNQVWFAEMAIPLKSFGVQMPAPGTRWRLNFFRWEHGPPKRNIVWKPTFTSTVDFHVPHAFGWLEFAK